MENFHGKFFVLPFLYVCDNLLFYTYQKILGLHKLEQVSTLVGVTTHSLTCDLLFKLGPKNQMWGMQYQSQLD
jgi:hypothetical protein